MLKKLQVTRPQIRTLLVVCFLVVGMLGCTNSDNPDTDSTDTDVLSPLRPGWHTFTFEDGQLFYVYVSPGASRQPAAARILASIHGVSGVTDDAAGREVVQFYLTLWEDMANQHGWVVVAPQFDQVRFNSFYQRLNKERGNQAWALWLLGEIALHGHPQILHWPKPTTAKHWLWPRHNVPGVPSPQPLHGRFRVRASCRGDQRMLYAATSGSRAVAGESGPRQAVGVMDQFHLCAL